MQVPLSWLTAYVEVDIPVEELAHRLTLAGLEVSAIDYIGLPASAPTGPHLAVPLSTDHLVWDREKIVVGHIVEVKPHPNADRLVLAMVDAGAGALDVCVTGAPNLYPYLGKGRLDPPLVAAYAREGAVLLDPYAEEPDARMVLSPRNLRGILNGTMVCSEKELGISDEHEGVLLMQSTAAPGTPLQDVLGDVILHIDLTPNLARCLSILGVAREVAALLDKSVMEPRLDVVATGPSIQGQVAVEIQNPELNPRFLAALLKGIEIKPSPEWLQRRLRKAGMRPINNIVDVTNYVMLETGEPLHAFDYDVLVARAGGPRPALITRTAKPGETLTTLDGVTRQLDPFTVLVADRAGPLSLAGIMGGETSEVGAETVNVLLEAASWDFINIRRTLQAQKERGVEINSEAAARFSRGVHPAQARVGLLRAAELMRQLAGGEIAAGIIDEYPRPVPTTTVDLPLARVEQLLGIAMEAGTVADLLDRLGFGVAALDEDLLRVTVPDHRLDIGALNHAQDAPIRDLIAQADVVEEVARIYGYDRIPNTLIEDALPPQRANRPLEFEEQVRDRLVEAGLQEISTYRLTTPEREALLVPPGASSDWPDVPYVTLANPISQERRVMRHTLLAGLLEVAGANARWQARQLLFEVGKVFLPVAGARFPDEPRRLALLLMGPRTVPAWQNGDGAAPQPMDFYDLKGVIEALLAGLHVMEGVRYEASEHSTFFPGRTASLWIGDSQIGTLGELHPLVRQAYELPEQPVLAAELDLEALLAATPLVYRVQPLSNYPAVYQDIAVVVDDAVPASRVEAIIRASGGSLLQDVRLFDVYRGEPLGPGEKSLAYALAIQAPDRTLRSEEADAVRAQIVTALAQALEARLRA